MGGIPVQGVAQGCIVCLHEQVVIGTDRPPAAPPSHDQGGDQFQPGGARLHRWSPVMRYVYGWERVGVVQRARPNAVTVSTPAGSTLRLTATRGVWLRQCEVYAVGERPADLVEER